MSSKSKRTGSTETTPDPTRLTLFFSLFAVVYALYLVLQVDTYSSVGFASGVGLVTLAVGPVASTTLGTRFRRWFRGRGPVGRLVVLGACVAASHGAVRVFDVPSHVATCLIGGGLLAVGFHSTVEYVRETRLAA